MRNLQILLALSLLACIAHADSYGGYSNITIYGNEDPGACQLTLWMNVTENAVWFYESVWNPLQDCTYQNLQWANNFRSDLLGDSIVLAPQDGSSNYAAMINMSDIANHNGTHCLYYSADGGAVGDDFWGCRFKYGSIYLAIGFLVNQSTGNFDPNWTDLIFLDYGMVSIDQSYGQNLVTPNKQFPNLVGVLRNDYNSWSTVVSNLSQHIPVQGTVLVSNTVDLDLYLSNLFLTSIFVRPLNSSDYHRYAQTSDLYPFSNATQGSNNISDIGLTWGDVLPDSSYCVNGCDVVFVILDGALIKFLGTTGISSVASNSTNSAASSGARNLRRLLIERYRRQNVV